VSTIKKGRGSKERRELTFSPSSLSQNSCMSALLDLTVMSGYRRWEVATRKSKETLPRTAREGVSECSKIRTRRSQWKGRENGTSCRDRRKARIGTKPQESKKRILYYRFHAYEDVFRDFRERKVPSRKGQGRRNEVSSMATNLLVCFPPSPHPEAAYFCHWVLTAC